MGKFSSNLGPIILSLIVSAKSEESNFDNKTTNIINDTTNILNKMAKTTVTLNHTTSILNESTNILATALFYKDSAGIALVATGPLPPDATQLITKDLRERFQTPLQIRVVPVYENFYNVPVHQNLFERLLRSYPTNMFILNLTPKESRRVMENIEKRVFMYNKTVSAIEQIARRENEEVSNITTTNTTTEDPLLTPENFIPNDIYYAIEKRCANWAPGCSSNAGSFFDMPSKYFVAPKVEYTFPFKLRWVP